MDKLLWIDLEMTGLDVEKEVIIEVGAIVSDLNLNVLSEYHSIVKQPQHYLDGMDDWNKKHHGESGLTAQVPNGREPALVEADLLSLVEREFKRDERPVLAGNSIAQDRLFIDKYFKTLSKRLHYRMLDVTAWKVLMDAKFKITFKKQDRHRAVDDIRESMGELKHYLQFIDPRRAQ